jgi:hypothetical protein
VQTHALSHPTHDHVGHWELETLECLAREQFVVVSQLVLDVNMPDTQLSQAAGDPLLTSGS